MNAARDKRRFTIAGGSSWRTASMVSVLLAAAAPAVADGPFYLNPADRVVFYGGAPPLGQLDTALIETYVATRFPQMSVEFAHRGWDGNWSRPGTQDRGPAPEILSLSPTAVVVGALPPSAGEPADLAGYASAYIGLVRKLRENNPALRITVAQPQPRGSAAGDNARRWDGLFRDLARDVSVLVHRPEALPRGPGDTGAIVRAAIDFLKSWNAPATVSLVEISAPGKSVLRSENTTIRELESDRVVAWSQDDSTLPLPPELSAAGGAALEQINVQILRVKGLITGQYKLTIDGWLMGTFEREDFERGIDLTKLPTPMLKQASQVFELTLKHIGFEYALWERALFSGDDPTARELEQAEKEALERRRIVGEPRTHDYEIIPNW